MADYRRWIINSPEDLRAALSEAHRGARIIRSGRQRG